MKNEMIRLGITASAELRPHEDFDASRVQGVTNKIREDGWLRHPILCLVDTDGIHYVADGHGRRMAALELGLRDLPVHLVSVRQVELHTWVHEVERLTWRELIEIFRAAGFEMTEGSEEVGGVGAWIRHPDGRVCAATDRSGDFSAFAHLRSAVDEYTHGGHVIRHINLPATSDLPIVHFPCWSVESFAEAVLYGVIFPAGVTRFLPKIRVLDLNVPLDFLMEERSTQEKSADLISRVERVGFRIVKDGRFEHYTGDLAFPQSDLWSFPLD